MCTFEQRHGPKGSNVSAETEWRRMHLRSRPTAPVVKDGDRGVFTSKHPPCVALDVCSALRAVPRCRDAQIARPSAKPPEAGGVHAAH